MLRLALIPCPLLSGCQPCEFVINNASVRVSITHPQTSDLTLKLIDPDGWEYTLSAGRGTGSGYTNTVFDDINGATPISAGTNPFTGTYVPEETLFNLRHSYINGNWKLQVLLPRRRWDPPPLV